MGLPGRASTLDTRVLTLEVDVTNRASRGQRFIASPETPLPLRPAPRCEVRPKLHTAVTSQTILFVDQVGSTRLVAELGNESMLTMRVRLWEIINTAVTAHNGRVFSDEGDGGAAAFPLAHDAAAAALEMLERTRHDNIEIRIGVNTGEVIANGDGLVGLAVHVAARLCDEAPHQHVVVSTSTVQALDDSTLVTTPFGHRPVKGLQDPVDVWLLTPAPLRTDEVDILATIPTWEPLPSSRLLEARTEHIVGRSSAQSQLLERAAATRSGTVELVLVGGNPGEGKSTLVQATALELAATGSLCLLGRADEAYDNAFNEIIEMFTHVIAEAPSALLADHVLRHGDLLTRLLPGLADRVPSASRWRDESTAAIPDRNLLFEAVADLLRSIAHHQSVVLVFEDVHWASAPTLDLVRYLLRSKDLGSVLLVVTYRPTEVAADSAAAQFLDLVRGDHASTSIALAPLTALDVEKLIRLRMPALATARPDLAEALSRSVHQQTGGNALFCTEVLRTFEASGFINDAELAQMTIDALLSKLLVPNSIQDVARQRADRLGGDVVGVLTDAAVLGESFATAELRSLHGTGGGSDVLDALDAAEHDGLLRAEDAAGQRYSFSHALVQQALYSRLATSQRLRRHHAAAQVIGALSTGAARAADALRHLQAAGVLAEASDIAATAGQAAAEALDRLALTEAMNFRLIAADATLGDPTSSAVERAHALAALGRAQTALGLQAGKASMALAADHARVANDWDLYAEIAANYGGDLKENQAVLAVAEPIALIEAALTKQPDASAIRARLLVSLALWKRQTTPYEERRAYVDEAVTIARSLDEPVTLATVLASHHRALHGPNIADEALTNAREIEQLAVRRADDSMLFQALYVRHIVAFETGDWELATATETHLRQVGKLLQNIEGQRLAVMWDAVTAALRGDFDITFEAINTCVELLVGYPTDDLGRFVAALSFSPLWLQGQSAMLYDVTRHDYPRASSLAWFAADSGQIEEAAAAITSSGGIQQSENQMDYMWWHDVVGLTRGARATNDVDTATQIYAAVLPFRSHNATMGLVSFFGAVEHHLGTLAVVMGKIDGAIDHFERGLARHRDMGARPFVALTAAELSLALIARGGVGDQARAADLRNEATSLADELRLGLVTTILDAHRDEQ